MSHNHERADKTCLNCDTHLVGHFCHVCGQENVEPKETVFHIIRHFFEDITHFDGKFLSSLKLLLFKPGFLTQEYLQGRRARYLNPIRMYMFISAIFFLVLLSITSKFHAEDLVSDGSVKKEDSVKIAKALKKHEKLDNDLNNLGKDVMSGEVADKAATNTKDNSINKSDSTQVTQTEVNLVKPDSVRNVHLSYSLGNSGLPGTVRQYDSTQKSLPPSQRSGFFSRYMERRFIAAIEYKNKHKDMYMERMLEKFFHSVPQMYFISLPLFAFILWLLYIRRRKQYNYVADLIFTIHFYCMSFIVFLLILILMEISDNIIVAIATTLLFFSIPAYLYISMLRFYKQGWFKTLIKAFLLNTVSSIFVVILVIMYILNSFLSLGA